MTGGWWRRDRTRYAVWQVQGEQRTKIAGGLSHKEAVRDAAVMSGGFRVSDSTIETAARAVGLEPQEWSSGGNRCMKATNGKTGRCHNRARWCDTAAAERYDRYGQTWTREPGSYAYKVCNRHAQAMIDAARVARGDAG
jgi:hypothetical protein